MAQLPIILSYVQVEPLLQAKAQGLATAEVSPDLGLTTTTVSLAEAGVRFFDGEQLGWSAIEKIKATTNNCFTVRDGEIQAIQVFSEATNRQCSLYPTRGVPSMLIAGFVMHRIKDIDPMQDTARKIKAIAPLTGRVLDTATGLGYTAIAAAERADEVITIELDPGAQAMARLNPWSQDLFHNARIQQIMGDAFEVVPTFADASFTRVIHDPPAFSLAGELYSGAFYRQLVRILKPGGRLFHYIGDLNSRSGGTVSRGAIKRLQEAGFARLVRHPEAFGVVAYKS